MTEAAVLTLPTAQNVTPVAPEPQPAPRVSLSPAQKAAVLVLQLGRQESSRVLSQLSESELEQLSACVAQMGSVGADVAAEVLAEFAEMVTTESPSIRGGLETAHGLLQASIGKERANAITERVSQNFVALPFAFLQKLDARQVVSFLSDEHPQTIALVLAHLPAELASLILAGLSRELQADVAHRIAVMDRTSPEVIRQVEQSLERRLSSLGVAADLSAVGGVRPLVDIINRSDRGTEKMILEGLEGFDPELAERVRAQMFMFEDIVGLDDRSIQLVLRQVQVNDLATALKGVSETVRTKIMQNMSERAALTLAEEIDLLGPVRINTVEEAQAGIVRVIRQLEDEGQVVIGRGGDDAFVA